MNIIPLIGLPRLMGHLQGAILVYFLTVNLFYFCLFVISFLAIIHYLRRTSYLDLQEINKSKLTPPISILIPAHNEAATIVPCVRALFGINYPKYEIIIINDGSDDATLRTLIQAFSLRKTKRIYHKTIPTGEVRGIYASHEAIPWAEIIVVDKEQGGKSDALNVGINVSQYPLFCSVDADSILERDALLRVVIPFMESFSSTMGVGGIVRVANGCSISEGTVKKIRLSDRWLPRFQAVEYLRAFLSGRIAWSKANNLLVISGAFGLFKKSWVIESQGYDTKTVGEDMELVMRLHRSHRFRHEEARIEFIPDPVCWTEVPETLDMLWRQRNRWQRGLGQALFRHRVMLFNFRFGLMGLLTVPYFWAVELLSPLVELLGYGIFFLAFACGALQWKAFATFFTLSVLMGINLSLLAVMLEEFTLHRYPNVKDFLRLLTASVLENFGYRQIVNLARLEGMFDLIRNKNSWGVLKKTGFPMENGLKNEH